MARATLQLQHRLLRRSCSCSSSGIRALRWEVAVRCFCAHNQVRTADNRLHAVCSDNALCRRSDTDNETAQVNPFSPSPRSRLTVDQESGCRIAHLTLTLRVCAVAVTEAGRDGNGSAGQAGRHAESLCFLQAIATSEWGHRLL